ncbi:solute carrier family 13 member 5 [Elysia marginata]|uniref:Solute carrier family 13 member 5 n=1 Tax=Elysia marginata TaxID=1093978 RepID=A0AAV4FJ29_9GAST|nr:solute carrier family 13 member 5 [Elysia marginata]
MNRSTQYILEDQSQNGHAHYNKRAHLWAWRRYIILFATPFLLAPLPAAVGTSESRCAYVVMLMAVYWFSEAIPVGVTALIPVVLFPVFGILDTNSTTMLYMKDTNMLFIGGFFMAVSIEYWGLHKRIALRILMLVGSEPMWLMLGLMGATWFLSMWISNTATTAMMVPITEAILQQLQGTLVQSEKETRKSGERTADSDNTNQSYVELSVISHTNGKEEPGSKGDAGDAITQQNGGITEVVSGPQGTHAHKSSDRRNNDGDAEFTKLSKGMSLCICYAASCGGIGSLTGTGPNLILKENSDSVYAKSTLSNPVNFGSWLAFGVPMSLMVVVICWFWLQIAFLGRRGILGCCFRGGRQDEETSRRVKQVIKDEYHKLGPIVFGEGMLLGLFSLLVILWVTRDMGGEAGWGKLFDLPSSSSSNSSSGSNAVVVAVVIVLLVVVVVVVAVVVVLLVVVVVVVAVVVVVVVVVGIVPSSFLFSSLQLNSVKDSVPAIVIGILLFVLPSTWPCLSTYHDYSHPQKQGQESTRDKKIIIRPLLNWQVAHQRMPWQLVFLLGGGFALSGGFDKSGLSDWIGDQLEFFRDWNEWAVLIMICYIAAACTEVTTNTAMSSVLLPIMERLAARIGSHPLIYMFPVCLSTSFAFMLPVATPPNAIVFTYGRVNIMDMVKAGIVMNILAVPCVVFMTKTLGQAVFGFDQNPADFLINATSATPLTT